MQLQKKNSKLSLLATCVQESLTWMLYICSWLVYPIVLILKMQSNEAYRSGNLTLIVRLLRARVESEVAISADNDNPYRKS